MVGTLVQVGLISELASYVERVTGDRFLLAILLLVWGSALVSGLVDNIPYVAMMTPVVATLSASLPAEAHGASLWWALALGADLGGNATAIGASANVIVLGVAARSGHPVSFWEFSRAGIPVTAMTLIVATAYLWLRYGVGT
jgi:Na+/H+ antiporter NhaD/arsenite permease-like protein